MGARWNMHAESMENVAEAIQAGAIANWTPRRGQPGYEVPKNWEQPAQGGEDGGPARSR